MFVLLLVLIVAVIASALLHSGESRAAMTEYCNLECIECKIQDYSICC